MGKLVVVLLWETRAMSEQNALVSAGARLVAHQFQAGLQMEDAVKCTVAKSVGSVTVRNRWRE
jgi:hypothetical protein